MPGSHPVTQFPKSWAGPGEVLRIERWRGWRDGGADTADWLLKSHSQCSSPLISPT